MKKEQIHSIVICERLDWREMFYLRVTRRGDLIVRNQNQTIDIDLLRNNKSQIIFDFILNLLDDCMLPCNIQDVFFNGIAVTPELTFIFSGENPVQDESRCISFTTQEASIHLSRNQETLCQLKRIAKLTRTEILNLMQKTEEDQPGDNKRQALTPAPGNQHRRQGLFIRSINNNKTMTFRQINTWLEQLTGRKKS